MTQARASWAFGGLGQSAITHNADTLYVLYSAWAGTADA